MYVYVYFYDISFTVILWYYRIGLTQLNKCFILRPKKMLKTFSNKTAFKKCASLKS